MTSNRTITLDLPDRDVKISIEIGEKTDEAFRTDIARYIMSVMDLDLPEIEKEDNGQDD